jgi:arylformamidase
MPTDTSPWIDITVPLSSGMVHWPGDPDPTFHRIAEISAGSDANVTFCKTPAHIGTHMDAPAHFIDGARTIESFPLSIGIGPAQVIHVPDSVDIITEREVERIQLSPGDRVLFRTRNSNSTWDRAAFQEDYVAMDATAARLLVKAGVSLIGVDYLSVGLFKGDNVETHRTILGAGIWIAEGLKLGSIAAGWYDLICLPLPISGSDGAPARVAVRPRSA